MALEFIANFIYDIIINHTDTEMYLRHKYIQPDSYCIHRNSVPVTQRTMIKFTRLVLYMHYLL